MITSLKKRVILFFDYKRYINEWLYLDGSTKDLSFEEVSLDGISKQKIYNDITKVLDDSSFIVRTSWWKDSLITSRINAFQVPEFIFASKSGYLDKFIRRNRLLDQCNIRKENIVIEGNYYKEYQFRCYLPDIEEVWLSSSDFYTRLKRQVLSLNKYPDKTYNHINEFKKVLELMQSTYTINFKSLSPSQYVSLLSEIKSNHLSFNEILDVISTNKWCKRICEFVDRLGVDECHEIIEDQKHTIRINRGMQSIYLIMNDDRFNGYDKYFTGHFAINDTFIHGKGMYNTFAEYLTLTNWIDSGKVKFLPDHLDVLCG